MDVLLNGKELFARQVRLSNPYGCLLLIYFSTLIIFFEKIVNFYMRTVTLLIKLVSIFPGERNGIYIYSFIRCSFSMMI